MKPAANPFAVPFPMGWFHPRSRAPLAARLGAVVEWRLSRLPLCKLETRPESSLQYVTMASRSHWLLLRESLVSLHRTWQTIPKLTVVSDGSWKREQFLEAFNFWPGTVKALMPEEITAPLNKGGQSALAKLADEHPLGLKLAAIIFLAQTQAILFADSDILWFKDPTGIIGGFHGLPGPATAFENGRSYNEDMVRRFCPDGLSAPGINTGLVSLRGELCAPDLLGDLLAMALEQPKHNFNEQTVIAVAAQKKGRKFPAEFCLVDFTDALTLKRRKPWQEGFYARHYVNLMRHQFYRDAVILRRLSV